MFYTRQSISDKFLFFQYPKVLLYGENYRGKLKPAERELYILLLDRTKLSIQNEWFDKEDRAFCIYANEPLSEILGVTKPTLISFKKKLKKLDLIHEESTKDSANRIYVKQLKITENDMIYIRKLEENTDENLGGVGELKNLTPPVKKFNTNKKEDSNIGHSGIELDFDVEKMLPTEMDNEVGREEEKTPIEDIEKIILDAKKEYKGKLSPQMIGSRIRFARKHLKQGTITTTFENFLLSMLEKSFEKKMREVEQFEIEREQEIRKEEEVYQPLGIPFYNWVEERK